MGLNDIRLTPSVLVELYGHSLVDTGDIPEGDQQWVPHAGPVDALAEAPPESRSQVVTTAFTEQPATKPEPAKAFTAEKRVQPATQTAAATNPANEPGHKPAQTAATKPAIEPKHNAAQTATTKPASEPKQNIAETAAPSTAPSRDSATPASPWRSLGNNRKKILIVVDYEGTAYLPDDELAFLTKMLDACKLSLDDVAIVNRAHYRNANANAYMKEFGSTIVFLFGPDPASFGLPLSFPAFQVQAFAGTTYLFTPALETRMRDDLFKSKLWVCLKRIFNL